MHREGTLVALGEEILAYGQRWLGGAVVVALALMLPLALAQSRWVPGLESLVPVTGAASLLGLALGRRRRVSGWGWLAMVLAGPTLSLLAASGAVTHPGEAFERLAQGVRRLQWWASVVWLGGSNDDPLAPAVVIGGAMWGISVWMGWATVRLKAGMAAVLPAGVVLAANTFFGLGGWHHLVAFIPLSMALLVDTRLRQLDEGLAQRGNAADPALRARSIALAAPAAGLALALALVLPPFEVDGLADAFWEQAETPWRRMVRVVKWLFPGVAARGEAPSWLEEVGAGLPTARELTGEVAPDEQLVMYVRTSDPPPLAGPGHLGPVGLDELETGPKRYWRGMTYDVYTGRGWANSGSDVVTAPAGQAFQKPEGPREELVQDFEMMAPRDELLFAVADPVAVNSEARLYWRGEGDLAYLKAPLGRYSVVSLVPKPDEAGLRVAGTDYPAWARERYLALPEVPRRVADLAAQVTAEADNPYDQLLAIQGYLRLNYDYDLEVPEPAEGKDVVDYFLFESRRGFCDYYASAMVVLARLAGIPARLASGYTTGQYDYAAEHYVVTAGQAHSWPEAYFPGFGWVEFEPTVTQTTFHRPAGVTLPESGAMTGTAPATTSRADWPWVALALVLLAGAGGVVAVVRRRLAQADPVLRAYQGMETAGERLGLAPSESLTPREYARRLESHMAATLAEVGVVGRNSQQAERAAAAMTAVAIAYERRRYAPSPLTELDEGIGWWPAAERYLRGLALRRLPVVWQGWLARKVRRVTRRGALSGPGPAGY